MINVLSQKKENLELFTHSNSREVDELHGLLLIASLCYKTDDR